MPKYGDARPQAPTGKPTHGSQCHRALPSERGLATRRTVIEVPQNPERRLQRGTSRLPSSLEMIRQSGNCIEGRIFTTESKTGGIQIGDRRTVVSSFNK